MPPPRASGCSSEFHFAFCPLRLRRGGRRDQKNTAPQHNSTTAPKHTITPRWSDHHPRMVGSSPPDGRIIAPGWSDHRPRMVGSYHPDGGLVPSRWSDHTIPMVVWYHPDGGLVPSAAYLPCFLQVAGSLPDGGLVPSRWCFGTIPMVFWYHPDGGLVPSLWSFLVVLLPVFLFVWSALTELKSKSKRTKQS